MFGEDTYSSNGFLFIKSEEFEEFTPFTIVFVNTVSKLLIIIDNLY